MERVRAGDDGEVASKRNRLRLIAQDAGPRWRPDLSTRDHDDLLYDERGLLR
jgi:hypothetical protein